MAEKWTPERRASLRRVIEAARRFVRCADEFVPEDGSQFYPDALGEYSDALDDALSADGRTWDEGPDAAPLDLKVETIDAGDVRPELQSPVPPAVAGERATRTG